MLKVGSPQPQPTTPEPAPMEPPMPPMEEPGENFGQEEMPDSDVPQSKNEPPMGGDEPNEFDSNFDAGVDANEEEDPKKYIQQLTGKLSQSLREYNQGLPHPDEDLCKFVAGMVVSQAIKGLTPDGAEDVLKKIKSDGNVSTERDDNDEDTTKDSADPEAPQEQMGESIEKRKAQIDEIFNDVISTGDDEDEYKPSLKKKSYRKTPYMPPMFR